MSRLYAIAVMLASAPFTMAAEPAPISASDAERVSSLVRDLLLQNLPDPIVESQRGWGHQKNVIVGVKWHRLRPESQMAIRNDGHWQKVRVQAIDPTKTLALGIRDLKYPEPGKMTFEALIGLDVRLTYEQQVWKSGHRLYGGETRARCRAALRLVCELTNRLDRPDGAILPEVVLRLKVTESQVFYADLVCEHALGMNGEAAKKLGETVHQFLTAVKPSLEQSLLAKANAAIVKAADTKEVRVALDRMLTGQPPAVTQQRK